MTFNVQSEAGQLRQVIVHRPGLELSRLTPRNIGELLFDDVMWAKKAKEEHDAFVETLREKGVRVHYFGQLLGETLERPEGRAFVLDRVCTPELLGPNLIGPLRRLFDDLDGPALAEYLVAVSRRPTWVFTNCGRGKEPITQKWEMIPRHILISNLQATGLPAESDDKPWAWTSLHKFTAAGVSSPIAAVRTRNPAAYRLRCNRPAYRRVQNARPARSCPETTESCRPFRIPRASRHGWPANCFRRPW